MPELRLSASLISKPAAPVYRVGNQRTRSRFLNIKTPDMDYRQLGDSGLKVSALSFGAGTFGGGTEFFRAWGETNVEEARRLLDICLDAGVNLFDTADVY